MNKKVLISILAVAALAVAGLGIWQTAKITDTNTNTVVNTNVNEVVDFEPIIVKLAIQDFTKPDITFEFTEPMTALSYLEFIYSNDPRLDLTTEVYEGMGVLVTKIGEHTNGDDGKYWQYYINGEAPMVSADQYQLQDGDFLEWKFISSQF